MINDLNQSNNIINGMVSEKSIEELLNNESKIHYESLKSQKTVIAYDFFETIYNIIQSTFKYDTDILHNFNIEIPKIDYNPNYTLDGVCRHGALFAKALTESLAPKIKTYLVHSVVEKENEIYHCCLGALIDHDFFIFNALSSKLKFGLILNNTDLKKIGKIEEIIDNTGEYLIDPILRFNYKKEIDINYSQKFLNVFERREKTILWHNSKQGKAKIASNFY